MPLSIIPKAPFPNVPQLPGVPQLVRSLLFPPSPLPTIGTEASGNLWASSNALPTWGVFQMVNDTTDNGDGTTTTTPNFVQVLDPDNVLNFTRRAEWRLPDFPLQDGGFSSYNKVTIPFELSVRMTKGGSLSDRTDFLATLEDIEGDLNLYSIVTPEVTYVDVNILRSELTRRGSEGAFYLTEVDVFFREINQVQAQYSTASDAAADTSNSQNSAAVPPVNQGNVQAQAAPSTAVTAAQNALTQAPM